MATHLYLVPRLRMNGCYTIRVHTYIPTPQPPPPSPPWLAQGAPTANLPYLNPKFQNKTICTQIISRHILVTCSLNTPCITTLPIRGVQLSFLAKCHKCYFGLIRGCTCKNHNNSMPNCLKYCAICVVYRQYII